MLRGRSRGRLGGRALAARARARFGLRSRARALSLHPRTTRLAGAGAPSAGTTAGSRMGLRRRDEALLQII
jgi:hypothetical protein